MLQCYSKIGTLDRICFLAHAIILLLANFPMTTDSKCEADQLQISRNNTMFPVQLKCPTTDILPSRYCIVSSLWILLYMVRFVKWEYEISNLDAIWSIILFPMFVIAKSLLTIFNMSVECCNMMEVDSSEALFFFFPALYYSVLLIFGTVLFIFSLKFSRPDQVLIISQ